MRVFKYRGGSVEIQRRDLRTVAKNQIFAASPSAMNDLFETRAIIHGHTFQVGKLLSSFGLVRYDETVRVAEVQFLDALGEFADTIRNGGIYSLSKTPTDELLWAHYGDSHRGMCFEYDLDRLMQYRLADQATLEVRYQDEVPTITLADLNLKTQPPPVLQKLIGIKSKRWAYEEELRVVVTRPGLFEYDFRALKSIYFGARSQPEFQRLVMRVMAGRGLAYFQVSPVEGKYALHAQPMPDRYARPVDYRKRVAPVAEGAPYFDENLERYRPLVLKAIEIVRRDPYCERVTDAYLSRKGTPSDPVFYVTYDRSDGFPRNYFLSKTEIEAWRDA